VAGVVKEIQLAALVVQAVAAAVLQLIQTGRLALLIVVQAVAVPVMAAVAEAI